MINYKEEIKKDVLNSHNVRDEYKNSPVGIRKIIQTSESKPFAVGLLNVTGELNIGTIIRTAALFGAENIFVFGRKEIDNRSHVGAINYVNIQFIKCLNDDLSFDIEKIRQIIFKYDYIPTFIETTGSSLTEKHWDKNQEWKPCLIFGNEGKGIPETVIKAFHFNDIISIPQLGVMRSHNVSVAAGIVMWEMSKQKGWL